MEKSLYLLLYLLLLINSTLSISVVVPSLALKCTPALEEVSSFALSGCKCKLKKLMPILRVALTFESVDKILRCGHLNENYQVVHFPVVLFQYYVVHYF